MSPTRNCIIQEDVAQICAQELPWERFAQKTILVSGANGFLPAYMVETLLHLNEAHSTNCRVIALVRNRQKAETRFAHVLGRRDFHLHVQDVCSAVSLSERADFIIHAASQASPKYYGVDPVGTLSANTLGTHNLLGFAKRSSAEGFLFFSSGDVYGKVSNPDIPITENDYGSLDPTDVRSCYGESKRLGETMCATWHHQFGIPVKTVRPAHTYGPGLALDDGRVFADFVANIVRGEDIVLKSAGTARRAFCYLADATLAFFTVLLRGENGQAYNVTNENCEISMVELANLLVGLFPKKKLGVKFADGAVQPGYIPSKIERGVLDTSKIRALGWAPKTSLEAGFRRTVESFA